MYNIRKYRPENFNHCVSIFKTNTPTFFDYSEQSLFENYLLKKDIKYYVLFNEQNIIVGSGGYGYNDTIQTVDFCWGMIDFNYHNKGFGMALLNYRVLQIAIDFPKTNISLNTSQHTFKFFERFGFQVEKITKNYYRKGLHRYDMIKIV